MGPGVRKQEGDTPEKNLYLVFWSVVPITESIAAVRLESGG